MVENKEIMNSLKKEIDEIKQKPLNKPEVCIMSWNEKYQLDNKILCLQEENINLHTKNESLQNKYDDLYEDFKMLNDSNIKLDKENEKLKKIIEILKYTNVNWVELKYSFSVTEYNIVARNSDFDELDQEEYDLLKEF